MKGLQLEHELRQIRSRYKLAKMNDELGEAVVQREAFGKLAMAHAELLLDALHRYNSPLSEGTEPEEESTGAPF